MQSPRHATALTVLLMLLLPPTAHAATALELAAPEPTLTLISGWEPKDLGGSLTMSGASITTGGIGDHVMTIDSLDSFEIINTPTSIDPSAYLLDIPYFVEIIYGGGSKTTIPEPTSAALLTLGTFTLLRRRRTAR